MSYPRAIPTEDSIMSYTRSPPDNHTAFHIRQSKDVESVERHQREEQHLQGFQYNAYYHHAERTV
eukprot:scaffold8678_cov172-Ochromonas_danica.AAC.3